jgi:hypothetical protein
MCLWKCYVSFILWYVDPLLGNDGEISKYTKLLLSNGSENKHISTAKILLQQRKDVFFVRFLPRFYKQNKSEVVSLLVR